MSQAPLPLTRREFIRQSTGGGLGFLAFSGFAPSFLSQSAAAQNPAPGRDQPILVIIQLGGGNDGLNTVIPFNDDNYFRLRPNLALRDNIIPISDQLALHPSLGQFQNLLNEGQLGIIQNVGYETPDFSHFRSMDIWESASDYNKFVTSGWMGRYIENQHPEYPESYPNNQYQDPLSIELGAPSLLLTAKNSFTSFVARNP